jgi:hypothetical protein
MENQIQKISDHKKFVAFVALIFTFMCGKVSLQHNGIVNKDDVVIFNYQQESKLEPLESSIEKKKR